MKKEKSSFIADIIESYKDVLTFVKLKRKLANDCLTLDNLYKKIKSDSELLKKTTEEQRKNIYYDYRQTLINSNKLAVLKTTEIEIEIEKKTFISKLLSFLPFMQKEVYDSSFIGLYINNGIGRLINIPQIKSKSISLLQQEQYNIEEYKDAILLNNKRLLFINNKTIFNPKLDLEKKDFLLDITPEYYWKTTNQVYDYNLTIPKGSNNLLGGMNAKKIIVILAILGIAFYLLSKKNGG
jgi:hypothetical protein